MSVPVLPQQKSRVMVIRQHSRFSASFSGTLIHQNHLHGISKAFDLSRKGCRLESSLRAVAGMEVELVLSIHEETARSRIRGSVVRWPGRPGIGIEFRSLVSPHQERLNQT